MQLTNAEDPMAKKKSDGTEPPTMAVKIDRALAKKAQMIATDKDVSLADYLSGALRVTIEKDWGKMIKKVGGDEK